MIEIVFNADWVVVVVGVVGGGYFAWPCLARATDFTMDGLISAVGVGSGSSGGRRSPLLLPGGRREGFVLLPRILHPPHADGDPSHPTPLAPRPRPPPPYCTQSGENTQTRTSLNL